MQQSDKDAVVGVRLARQPMLGQKSENEIKQPGHYVKHPSANGE